MNKKYLSIVFLLCCFKIQAQWTSVDFINFNGSAHEADIADGGTPYWDNAASPSTGPRNGLINGTWEVANTGLGATQSPTDAAGGRFLMYWSDNQYTGTPVAAPGIVWSKTYTGLTIGATYRYSFLSGYLVCPTCVAPTAGATLPALKVLLDGATIHVLPTMVASWSSTTDTFIATATSHTLAIYNSNSDPNGNDFGLDDIKLESFTTTLPLELLSFTSSKLSNCNNQLNWKTANEEKFNHFEIQQSNDGSHFTSIGTIQPTGNNDGEQYQFIAPNTMQQNNYYRLLIVELNGIKIYSNIIHTIGCKTDQVTIYPNPLTDLMNIDGLQAGDLVQIIDLTGRTIFKKTAAQSNLFVNTRIFSKGIYSVAITHSLSGTKTVSKVTKQ